MAQNIVTYPSTHIFTLINKIPPEAGPSGPSQQSPQKPKLPILFLDEMKEDDKDMEETSVKTKNIKYENLEKWI